MCKSRLGEEKQKAIVLLSGGLDSTTCLAIAKDQDYALYALSFRYGQRHLRELDMARRIRVHFESILFSQRPKGFDG